MTIDTNIETRHVLERVSEKIMKTSSFHGHVTDVEVLLNLPALELHLSYRH